MYRPAHFKVEDLNLIKDFIKTYPLGVLISPKEHSVQINYLPFLISSENDKNYLLGHMAKANPQAQLQDGTAVVITFQGPDRYISPTWYQGKMEVPTWNYAAVEVHGRIEILNTFREIDDILTRSTEHFEQQNQTTWNYNLPERFQQQLISHIVGIRIEIESIEGKFKLSQNRKPEDQKQVLANLEKSPKTSDQEMLSWMHRFSCRNT